MLTALVILLFFSLTISQSIPLSFGSSSNISLYSLDDCKSGATESFSYRMNTGYYSISYPQGYNWNQVSCNNSGKDASSTQNNNEDLGNQAAVLSNSGNNPLSPSGSVASSTQSIGNDTGTMNMTSAPMTATFEALSGTAISSNDTSSTQLQSNSPDLGSGTIRSDSNSGTNSGLNWEQLCNQYHDLLNLKASCSTYAHGNQLTQEGQTALGCLMGGAAGLLIPMDSTTRSIVNSAAHNFCP